MARNKTSNPPTAAEIAEADAILTGRPIPATYLISLPERTKHRIIRDMAAHGPRAVIEAVRNALNNRQPDASEELARANARLAAVLTEILSHWKE